MIKHIPWLSLLAGYALGWLMGRLDRETQDDHRRRINHENRNGPVGSPPLKLRRSEPDPWQRQHLIRAEGFCIPPETDPRFGVPWEEGTVQRGNGHGGPTTTKPNIVPQPLTADLIRYWQWRARAWSAVSYWQWQDEQVRQALEEDTNPPPKDKP